MAAPLDVDGDELVTCPYEPVHRLKRSRMQMHLVKCAKNHPDKILKECPFNHIHRIEEHEFQHHLLNCPQRGKVDRLLGANIDCNNPYKGHTGVPSYSTVQDLPEPTECWENEISPVPVAGYVPSKEIPKGGVFDNINKVTIPSERKLMYKKIALSATEEKMNENSIPGLGAVKTKSPVQDAEPRKPRQRYEEAYRAGMLHNGNVQTPGLGRGHKTDSRIAANIFSSSSSVTQQPLNNITQGMKNLGMGRGRGNPGLACLKNYENDFPVLGMGRGNPVRK